MGAADFVGMAEAAVPIVDIGFGLTVTLIVPLFSDDVVLRGAVVIVGVVARAVRSLSRYRLNGNKNQLFVSSRCCVVDMSH